MKDLTILKEHLKSLEEYQEQGVDPELTPIIEALKRTIKRLEEL